MSSKWSAILAHFFSLYHHIKERTLWDRVPGLAVPEAQRYNSCSLELEIKPKSNLCSLIYQNQAEIDPEMLTHSRVS